jgi:uncharacterized membrane protein
VSRIFFAAVMIALGIQGLVTGTFTAVWQPVPRSVPGRDVLAYVCALLSLSTGLGFLLRRTAGIAARALLAGLIVWLLVWRAWFLFAAPLIEGSWSFAATLVMIAGAGVLFARFDTEWGRRLGFTPLLRTARILYAIGLIPFGYAHFANVNGTAGLVPAWLPWHVAWAYVTGATFLAASVAILIGRFARQAAGLSTLQMALFGLLVWVPPS